MKRCSFRATRGFTLLELCTVLLIIVVLLGVMMPAIQSTFVESALRVDARQLSLAVKTAMLKSDDEHQDYVVDLTAGSVALHPAGPNKNSDGETDPSIFDRANKLLIPDPKKAGGWIKMPETSWLFSPGNLCPATRVRLARGNAWLEMSFNALTGNVENETAYFP